MSSSSDEIRDAALALVKELGWYVFRLRIGHDGDTCDGGTANCKTVKPLDHWRETLSNDLDVVAGWDWSQANAYGIDCDTSGIVVADQDPGSVWPFNGTRVHTSGRGLHHIYEDLIGLGNRTHVQPWGIDVRGIGGMIIGPGSWHPHGTYAVDKDVAPAPPPPELVEAIRSVRLTAEQVEVVALAAFEARTRLEGVYAAMTRVEKGSRNHELNKLAGTAAGLWVRIDEDDRVDGLTEDDIKARLLAAITDDGDPAKSQDTIRRGWLYGLEHPISDRENDLRDLFGATPTLRHIGQAAHARLVGAPALLCYVLARVIAEVPPYVGLPPVVGGKASLNLGVAIVGGSGAGKSALLSVSREVLGLVGAVERNVGSGEGLVAQFIRYDKTLKDNVLIDDPRRILMADEIDQLGATQHRSGATIAPTLRSALTGGPLGQANASAERNRHVSAGTYRLVLLLGVQPTRSATLLDDSDAGTPQRLVWVWAADPSTPDEDVPWPGLLDWDLPAELPNEIDYPTHIKAEVRAARRAQVKGGGDPLAGHKLLTRLKVAAGFALLHGDTAITDQWWALAGQLLDMSTAVQTECRARLSAEVAIERRNQGRLDGIRQEGAAEYHNERVVAAAAAIWRKADKHATGSKDGNDQRHEPDEGCTARCFSKAVQNFVKKDPGIRDQALPYAADADWIEERDGRWFPGVSRPAEPGGQRG